MDAQTSFFNSEGSPFDMLSEALLIDFKEINTTVNATNYASLLHKLHDAIKEKR
jgi:hypothetical protein